MFSLISFVRFAVGVPLSFFISNTYSPVIYNQYVKEFAIEKITSQIDSSANIDAFVETFRKTLDEFPFGLGNMADFSFLDNASSSSLANGVVDNILEPIALILIEIVLFVLTLWAFYVITWIIIKIIRSLTYGKKFPFRKTNKFLGAVFGVLKAVIAVFAFAAIFDFVKDITVGADGEFIAKLVSQINSSVILEFVNKFNPILTI